MILTKTDKTIKAFEKEIKRLLKEGKTAKEAVKEAYKKYPIMKTLEKELQKQLEEEMKRGAGEDIPINAIHDALSLVWSPDNLTLSERTTKGGKEITAQAASIIAEAIKKGKSVQKTALALFDGYGYGHVLPTQDIPEFMKKLTEIGRLTDYKGQEFRKTLRDVERQLKRVNVQGMKIAYGKIKEAIETGNEKKINKAVYVATQERTRYFARRIARTELARAYGDGAMAKWENDEDCVAFQWKLSTGHPFCDICDLYANADLYGMGKGIFPKDKVPRLPVHPNCMCHLRPVMEGSRLLQGEEKEQIDKGGMAYIKKLSKHDQERLLGVHGRLEVLKRGKWTEKARGYSGEKMKSRIEHGIINIKIDGLTPCLVERKTGAVVNTSFTTIHITSGEAKKLKNSGWKFDWSIPEKEGYKVYKLTIRGKDELQGLISLKAGEGYIFAGNAENAPHNFGHLGRYAGTGGHLFAIACLESKKLGFGGFVVFDAKTGLLKHYEETLSAIRISSQRMYIDELAAEQLLKRYGLGEKDE